MKVSVHFQDGLSLFEFIDQELGGTLCVDIFHNGDYMLSVPGLGYESATPICVTESSLARALEKLASEIKTHRVLYKGNTVSPTALKQLQVKIGDLSELERQVAAAYPPPKVSS